jgi:hypothetical protein
MKIDFELEGMRELIGSFEKIERGVVDLRQLGTWKAVRTEFHKVQKDIFAAEGPGWKGLSHPYAEIKQAKWGVKPILQASGAMYKEFTANPQSVEEKPQELTLKFSPPAGFHMSKDARGKMPYRSSLDLNTEQQKQIFAPVGKKLKQLIDNAKLKDIRGF